MITVPDYSDCPNHYRIVFIEIDYDQIKGNKLRNMAASGEETTSQLNNLEINNTENADKVHEEEEEDVVDPWKVVSKSAKGVDYDKLISKFLCCLLRFSQLISLSVYHVLCHLHGPFSR